MRRRSVRRSCCTEKAMPQRARPEQGEARRKRAAQPWGTAIGAADARRRSARKTARGYAAPGLHLRTGRCGSFRAQVGGNGLFG